MSQFSESSHLDIETSPGSGNKLILADFLPSAIMTRDKLSQKMSPRYFWLKLSVICVLHETSVLDISAVTQWSSLENKSPELICSGGCVWCPSHSYLRSHISHVSLNQIWINFCYRIAYFSSQTFSETCFIEPFSCNMKSLVTSPSFFSLLDRTTHSALCFGCSDWL